MEKPIITSIFIVAGLVMALTLFNAAFPAVVQGGDAIAGMTSRSEDRMRSQIGIIHAAAELDSSGWWQDTNGNGDFDVFIWVKNTGVSRITSMDRLDVFFGPEGNFIRIPNESEAGGSQPYWSWSLENASEWVPTSTLKITLHYGLALSEGRYFVKVTTASGISDTYFLSM